MLWLAFRVIGVKRILACQTCNCAFFKLHKHGIAFTKFAVSFVCRLWAFFRCYCPLCNNLSLCHSPAPLLRCPWWCSGVYNYAGQPVTGEEVLGIITGKNSGVYWVNHRNKTKQAVNLSKKRKRVYSQNSGSVQARRWATAPKNKEAQDFIRIKGIKYPGFRAGIIRVPRRILADRSMGEGSFFFLVCG